MRLSVRFGSGEFSDSEPGEVAVPVDGVLAGGRQGGDAACGEAEGASLRHGDPRRRAPGPVRFGLEACNQTANARHQSVGVA